MDDFNKPNPHPKGSKKAARWEDRKTTHQSRQAKAEARARSDEELAGLAKLAQQLGAKPPAAFGAWGVTRTRAWARLATLANRWGRAVRPSRQKLEYVTRRLREVNEEVASLDSCARIIDDKNGGFEK